MESITNMILNEGFIVFYLVWYFCMQILYKENWLPNKIDSVAHVFNINSFFGGLLLELSECKFCQNFWTSTIAAIIAASYYMDYKYLFWGVFCASIAAHFKE